MTPVEKRLGKICDEITIGIVLLDKDYTILDCNAETLRRGKVKKEEIIGKNFLDLVIDEDRKIIQNALERAKKSGEARTDVVRLTNTHGQTYFVELRFNFTGEFFVATIIDRTRFYEIYQETKIIKSATDNMVEALVVADVNGTIQYVNPAFTKLTGYTAKEAIGQNPRILKSGKHTREFYKNMWDTILSGKIWHGELINKRKDGTLYWEEMTIVPVKNEKGEIINFVAIKHDITERKKLEEKLEEERKFYKSIIDSSPDGIFIETLDGKIIDVNKQAAEMLGYTREELLEKGLEAIIPEEMRDRLPTIGSILKKNKHIVMEVFNRHKKGYLVPIELSANLVEIGGKELVIIIARDLSKRNEIEMRYRAIGEMARDAIIMVDSKGRIEYWNPAAEKIFGYTAEEIVGKKYFEYLVPKEYRERTRKIAEMILKGTLGFKRYPLIEVPAQRKNGEIFFLEISPSAFIINGKVHALITGRDITERKEREKEILRLATALEHFSDGVILTDNEGKIIYANKAMEEIFGWKKDELLGKHVSIFEVYEGQQKKELEEMRKSGKWEIETVRKDKYGNKIPVHLKIIVVRDKNGKVKTMGAILEDIRERKAAEERLLKQNQQLQLLYDFTQSISSELDLQKLYLKIYEELKKIMRFDTYSIAVYDEKNNEVRMEKFIEEDVDITYKLKPLKLTDSLTGFVIKTGKTLLLKDFERDVKKVPVKVHVIGWIPGSFLGVPLRYKNKVIGAVFIQSKEKNIGEEEKKLLETIAPVLSIAIANAQLYTETEIARERFENLINTSIVGIVTTDLDDNITFTNRKFAEMLGYRPEELIGKNLRELTTEEGYRKMKEGTERRKKGISDSYESVFITKDGKLINVLIHASPLKDSKGNVIGTIGVNMDITERKRWEERLRKEWEKYKNLLENMLSGIAVIQDEKMVFVNKALADMLGYAVNEMIGERFTKFVHPDMRDYLLENYRRRMRGEKIPESYIVKFLKKNGEVLWALTKANVVEWEGAPGDMVSLQDITQIKEMEDNLIAMVKVFEEIKLARNEDEIYEIAIDSLYNILNFRNVAIGKVVGDKVIIRKHRGYTNPDVVLDLYGDKGITPWVIRNKAPYYSPDVTKDPLYVPGVESARCEYATPIYAKDKVYGVLDVQRDEVDSISEDERLLLDMLASHMGVALAGLEAMEEEKKARNLQELMVHIISHDLKNPLAVLRGYIDLMREMPSEEFLEAMDNAIKEAEEIIERARLFSKLGRKKIDEEKEEINLREMIEGVASLIREKYPEKELRIDMKDIFIEAYPILKEVFTNLLDNAFKYGANRVDVTAEEKDYMVEIRIADDGPGIPDKIKKKIFEPFQRADTSVKGSGLGLTIVKMLVELHDGEIWVEDNKPQGSIFVVRIPKE